MLLSYHWCMLTCLMADVTFSPSTVVHSVKLRGCNTSRISRRTAVSGTKRWNNTCTQLRLRKPCQMKGKLALIIHLKMAVFGSHAEALKFSPLQMFVWKQVIFYMIITMYMTFCDLFSIWFMITIIDTRSGTYFREKYSLKWWYHIC